MRLLFRLCAATVLVACATQLDSSPRTSAAAAEPPTVCGVAEVVDELLCPNSPSGDSDEPSGGVGGGPAAATGDDTATTSEIDASRETPPRPALEFDSRRIAVTFERGTSSATAEQVLADAGVVVQSAVPAIRAYLVLAKPDRREQVLSRLSSSRHVTDASREVVAGIVDTTPNDRYWPFQSGLRLAGFHRAWDMTRGSSAVVVAVVDTGADRNHPDLAGALVPGYDFVNRDSDPQDDEGHGTAVAGVIAARANNGEGIAGICWACRVMPVKVLDSKGSGSTTQVAAGVVWAADHGANIINLSLGAPATTAALSDAVAYATRKGAIVVAAAGNAGTSAPFYPAAEPDVLSVAATDSRDQLYSWSNRGTWVRMAAPGCNLAPIPGGYGNFCGTSSSAPVVAGLVALARTIKAAAPAIEIDGAIEQTAARLQPEVRSGRIDSAAALARLTGPPAQPQPDPALRTTVTVAGTLTPARTVAYRRPVGAGALKATFSAGREPRLTISLVAPDGVVHRASGPSPLQLERRIPAGTAQLTVGGAARKVDYTLTLSHVVPPTRRASLPAIPPAPPLTGRKVGAALGRPAPPPDVHASSISASIEDVEGSEPPILAEVNAVRRSFRLRPLRFSALLAKAADAHAASMGLRGYFAHEWSDGTPFRTWILRYYPAAPGRAWLTGENLAWAAPVVDAKKTVKAWLASPPHRRNLLDPRWREVGIGVVRAKTAGGVFGGHNVEIAAAEFGRR